MCEPPLYVCSSILVEGSPNGVSPIEVVISDITRITPSPSPKYLRKFSHLTTYESAGSSGAKILQLVKQKPSVQQKMDSYFEDEIRASGGRVK